MVKGAPFIIGEAETLKAHHTVRRAAWASSTPPLLPTTSFSQNLITSL